MGDADAVPYCPRIALTVLSGAGWVPAGAPSLFSALPRQGLVNSLFCFLLLHLESCISRILSPAANGKMVKENSTLAASLSASVSEAANQKYPGKQGRQFQPNSWGYAIKQVLPP